MGRPSFGKLIQFVAKLHIVKYRKGTNNVKMMLAFSIIQVFGL